MVQRGLHFFVFWVGVAGILSGCNPDLSDVCAGKYDHQFTDAIAQLTPMNRIPKIAKVPRGKGRSPASLNLSSKLLNEEQRSQWQAWAEGELKRVEAYIDYTNLHRHESPEGEKARQALFEAANHLVAFHGYSQQGRVDQMIETLQAIESQRQVAQTSFCQKK